MRSTHDPSAGAGLSAPFPVIAEFVGQGGPFAGARYALPTPVATAGSSDRCDIRLSGEDAEPLHCAFFPTADGVGFVDLKTAMTPRVNGQPALSGVLRDGDYFSLGNSCFRVSIPERTSEATAFGELAGLIGPSELESIREALQIQAAAVAAQQGALEEEEARLQQRRAALEQQEAQLASHLEEKRRRLVKLRDHCQAERKLLDEERIAHGRQVSEDKKQIAQAQADLAAAQTSIRAERQRLLGLRRKLKQRFHRHWLAQRQRMRQDQEELAARQQDLYRQAHRLEEQRHHLVHQRQRAHTEIELRRRQVEADAEKLQQAERQWQDRRAREEAAWRASVLELDQRAQALAEAETEMAKQRSDWEARCAHLRREAEGLDARIENQRRRLLELELSPESGSPARQQTAATADVPPGVAVAASPQWFEQLASMEQLATDLADQRSHLAEQWERLARAQENAKRHHESVAAELDSLARRLVQREELIAEAEAGARQRQLELVDARRQVEVCLAQARTHSLAWEAERDRWVVALECREKVVERQASIVGALRRRWHRRYRDELKRLRQAYVECQLRRQEFTALREQWLSRTLELSRQERSIGERTLALEQYRQQWTVQATDPALAEKRLEHLRRQCAHRLAAEADRLADLERQLRGEVAEIESRWLRLESQATEIATRSAVLARRETAWEHRLALARTQAEQSAQELQRLRGQQELSQRQIAELTDEAERMARLMLDDSPPAALPAARAA